MLYPASITIDFYIQADSLKEAEEVLERLEKDQAFNHDDFSYPEIEQPEYENCVVNDVEESSDDTICEDNFEEDNE